MPSKLAVPQASKKVSNVLKAVVSGLGYGQRVSKQTYSNASISAVGG